jgi:ElaA protein
LAYLRILDNDGPLARIGRVVTAKDARGLGLANQLMAAALAVIGNRAIALDAQSHVVTLYERYGFRPSGPEFVEDGIAHVPMRREAAGG